MAICLIMAYTRIRLRSPLKRQQCTIFLEQTLMSIMRCILSQHSLRHDGGSGGGKVLPGFVLVAIRIVADPLDDDTRNFVPCPCTFHLERNEVVLGCDLVPIRSTLHDCVARPDSTDEHPWPKISTRGNSLQAL